MPRTIGSVEQQITRRDALRRMLTGASALGAAVLVGCDTVPPRRPPSSGTVDVATGCHAAHYAGASARNLGCGFVNTLGHPVIDQQFVQEVQIQTAFWSNVPARVSPFDECSPDRANAAALPQGDILIGFWMAQSILRQTNTGLPIAGVLAHEWGHQVQFRFGYMNEGDPTVRRDELEADAFSGYFMGLAKGWAGAELTKYLDYMESIGDTNFNSPNHHGTHAERRAASSLGMMVASEVIRTGQYLTYEELHQLFEAEIGPIVVRAASARPRLSLAAQSVADGLNRALLAGIRDGTRSASELQVPPATLAQRSRYFPR